MQKGEKIVILVAATESKPSNSIFNIGINTFLINFDKVQLKKKDHQDDFQNFWLHSGTFIYKCLSLTGTRVIM